MRLYRRRTEVRPLLELVVQRHRPTFGRRIVSIQCDAVPPVFVDSSRLLQVLSNLLSNATKFTQEDGTITLRGRLWGDQVALAVQDDGPGIAPEDMPKLFQKFSQVGLRDSSQPKGTGLGLVVSQELVELHKGHIEVASEHGLGSTFTVLLPKYSDAFALAESFQELSSLAALGEGKTVGVIMIDVGDTAEGRAPSKSLSPQDMVEAVRQQLHKDDVVLDLQPPWVAILMVTTPPGLPVIVGRLNRFFNDARLRFGMALYTNDGTDIVTLIEQAKQRCKGLA